LNSVAQVSEGSNAGFRMIYHKIPFWGWPMERFDKTEINCMLQNAQNDIAS